MTRNNNSRLKGFTQRMIFCYAVTGLLIAFDIIDLDIFSREEVTDFIIGTFIGTLVLSLIFD